MPPTESGTRIEPFDRFNQELVSQVHPPDWINPEPKPRYHLVVLGAGTGGLVSAAIAAGLGARVALVERHLMGGDCLNVGCVPSKAIIAAARSWRAAAESAESHGGPRIEGSGNFAAVMQRMRRLRAGLSRMDSASRFRQLGVDVFLGEGKFTGPDRLEVGGKTLRFRRAILATGTRPATPSIPGLDRSGFFTNETIFSLTELPRRLAVIGAGPVGCELAQAFARFGAEVTVINQQARILQREDPDASRIVEHAMERHGVRLMHQAKTLSVEVRDGQRVLQIARDGRVEEIIGDQVLVAVGRVATLDDLGLELAGVEHRSGRLAVDDRFRTSNPRIYAIGDVGSRSRFTHAADAQARLVIGNALFFGFGGGKSSRLVMPRVTYTTPEIAHVGLDQEEATAAGYELDAITVPLDDVDRAVLDGEEEGFLRVHLKKGSDRILGATLVAEHAGDMIGEIGLAITAGLRLSAIGTTIHPYPTQGEIFRKAADAWRRTRLTPAAKRVFRAFFRVFR